MKEVKAIKFKNFTTEDFTHTFDGIPYTFKAGQEVFLEDFKAYHFTKHLVDRELNKKNIVTNNLSERKKLETLCLPSDEVITPLEALQVNEEVKVKERKAKKTKKVEAEEEFEDLNK